MGMVWRRLGAEVTVVEYLDSILPNMDAEVAKMMDRLLRKKGFKIRTGMKVTGAKTAKNGVSVSVEPAKGGEAERSEEHTSELQSLMRISYAVFCLKKKKKTQP